MRRLHSTSPRLSFIGKPASCVRACFDWKARRRVRHRGRFARSACCSWLPRPRRCSAVVKRFFSFSHETASRAVKANLPDMEPGARLGGFPLRRRPVLSPGPATTLAVGDRHPLRPLLWPTHSPWVMGGPKKQGTKWFFGYATAVLLQKRRRFMIALCPLAPKIKPHEIVRTLLDQIAEKGLKIRGVVLDSGFDSGETLLLLQERHLAYTVPLRRKGNASNARNRLFEGRQHQIRWAEWYVKDTPRQVEPGRCSGRAARGRCSSPSKAGTPPAACTVHQEAARQKRLSKTLRHRDELSPEEPAQATTTSRDPVYRLLLEGLGYLIRQVWVVLTAATESGAVTSSTPGLPSYPCVASTTGSFTNSRNDIRKNSQSHHRQRLTTTSEC